MRRLAWQPASLSDVSEIKAYIARDNPAAARRVAARIVACAKHLKTLPRIGRPGEVAGTRELIVQPWRYVLVYRERGNAVEVIGVFQGARLRTEIVDRRMARSQK